MKIEAKVAGPARFDNCPQHSQKERGILYFRVCPELSLTQIGL